MAQEKEVKEDAAVVDQPFDPSMDMPIEEAEPVKKPEAAAAEAEPEEINPKTEHSRRNHRLALSYGATEEQIKATSPDQLEAWLDAQEAQESARATRAAREQVSRPAPVQEAPAEEADPDLPDLGFEATPQFAAYLKAQAKEKRDLQKKLDQVEQREKDRVARDLHESVEEVFAELGSYGKGNLSEISAADRDDRLALLGAAGVQPNDSPAVARRKMRDADKRMKARYGASSSPAPKPAAELEEPTAPLSATQPNGKPRITPQDFVAAATARPNGRGEREQPRGKDKAMAEVYAKLRDQGANPLDTTYDDGRL